MPKLKIFLLLITLFTFNLSVSAYEVCAVTLPHSSEGGTALIFVNGYTHWLTGQDIYRIIWADYGVIYGISKSGVLFQWLSAGSWKKLGQTDPDFGDVLDLAQGGANNYNIYIVTEEAFHRYSHESGKLEPFFITNFPRGGIEAYEDEDVGYCFSYGNNRVVTRGNEHNEYMYPPIVGSTEILDITYYTSPIVIARVGGVTSVYEFVDQWNLVHAANFVRIDHKYNIGLASLEQYADQGQPYNRILINGRLWKTTSIMLGDIGLSPFDD